MAKQHAKLLNLEDKEMALSKFSNNTEFHGSAGDWEGAWTFNFSGLMLTRDELNDFRGDKHTFASWFDNAKGVQQPMPWWGGEIFRVSESFEAEQLVVALSGGRECNFEAVRPKKPTKDDPGKPACVLSKITLRPQYGGLTEMCGHLTVHPGLGAENKLLQQAQHSTVTVSICDAKPKEKAQGDLLEAAEAADNGKGESAQSAAATH